MIALTIVWMTRTKPLWMLSDMAFIVAGFSGLVAGVFKEVVIDLFVRHSGMEFADIVLTLSGSLALVFLLKIIHAIKTEIMKKKKTRPVDPPPPPPQN